MEALEGARVMLTGASGFLGQVVHKHLTNAGASVFPIQRSTGYDLTLERGAYEAVISSKPDIIVHLAARVGGIVANMAYPGQFFDANISMGRNIVNAANAAKARLISIGTICSYPKHCPVPFKEEDFWNGYPEETNAPYGIAKKSILTMMQAYRREFGFKFGYVSPTNLYGPNDNFDLKMSHVIPAMIKKFVAAKLENSPEVKLLGTGKVTRSFLFVEDCAEAITLATAKLDYDDVVNLPGCPEISMRDLGDLIAKLVGYRGSIAWDPSMPDGQPRRLVDGARARNILGWVPSTLLEDGLRKTIDWYVKNISK